MNFLKSVKVFTRNNVDATRTPPCSSLLPSPIRCNQFHWTTTYVYVWILVGHYNDHQCGSHERFNFVPTTFHWHGPWTNSYMFYWRHHNFNSIHRKQNNTHYLNDLTGVFSASFTNEPSFTNVTEKWVRGQLWLFTLPYPWQIFPYNGYWKTFSLFFLFTATRNTVFFLLIYIGFAL